MLTLNYVNPVNPVFCLYGGHAIRCLHVGDAIMRLYSNTAHFTSPASPLRWS
jgi:hypothetical protein